ncbi:MAG: PilZ domain-containing protein [Desulfobacteraceae bacterium]|nr:PilZ domain-containing protein [Desulfobacteraceae bacterium]
MKHSGRDKKQKRENTRTKVWPDTRATIKVADPMSKTRKILTIKGVVGDLGSSGMFLITNETVSVPAKAEIIIDFDPSRPSSIVIEALGEVVRSTQNGLGIRFTSINIDRLQKCILARMNR